MSDPTKHLQSRAWSTPSGAQVRARPTRASRLRGGVRIVLVDESEPYPMRAECDLVGLVAFKRRS